MLDSVSWYDDSDYFSLDNVYSKDKRYKIFIDCFLISGDPLLSFGGGDPRFFYQY
jgi:hypothetical protein